MKKRIVAITALGTLAVAGVGAATWMAVADEPEVQERGACGGAAYELSVEDDDGGLELDFELQSAGPGEAWVVEVRQGDSVVLEGERSTDEDGELDVDAAVEKDGSQAFVVTATPAQGEPCVAEVTR